MCGQMGNTDWYPTSLPSLTRLGHPRQCVYNRSSTPWKSIRTPASSPTTLRQTLVHLKTISLTSNGTEGAVYIYRNLCETCIEVYIYWLPILPIGTPSEEKKRALELGEMVLSAVTMTQHAADKMHMQL